MPRTPGPRVAVAEGRGCRWLAVARLPAGSSALEGRPLPHTATPSGGPPHSPASRRPAGRQAWGGGGQPLVGRCGGGGRPWPRCQRPGTGGWAAHPLGTPMGVGWPGRRPRRYGWGRQGCGPAWRAQGCPALVPGPGRARAATPGRSPAPRRAVRRLLAMVAGRHGLPAAGQAAATMVSRPAVQAWRARAVARAAPQGCGTALGCCRASPAGPASTAGRGQWLLPGPHRAVAQPCVPAGGAGG